jgi:hypothetical protein
MGRSHRPYWLALGVSLLLHGGLIAGLGWRLPQWDLPAEPPAFDAELAFGPAPALPESPPTRTPPPAPPKLAPVSPSLPAADLSPELPVVDGPAEAGAPEASADGGPIEPEVAAAETAQATQTVPVEAAPPPLNRLPPRLDLRYAVRYGLAGGEQTLLWVIEGERYTVTSVAAATGLTGVFYRGRFVQTSRGRITPRGLQPEEFWDQRGDKRSSARFDEASATLTLTPAKGEPRHFVLQGEVQDALSLFFQMALTAPPSQGRLTFTVFNGKKLRSYTYEVRGEETLETALGTLRTLHLARVGGDGRFEVWLAIDRHYLPVRIVRAEGTGTEGELTLRSIEGE